MSSTDTETPQTNTAPATCPSCGGELDLRLELWAKNLTIHTNDEGEQLVVNCEPDANADHCGAYRPERAIVCTQCDAPYDDPGTATAIDILTSSGDLALSFTPDVIREHFQVGKTAEWVAAADDTQLLTIGYDALNDERLHDLYYDVIRTAIAEMIERQGGN